MHPLVCPSFSRSALEMLTFLSAGRDPHSSATPSQQARSPSTLGSSSDLSSLGFLLRVRVFHTPFLFPTTSSPDFPRTPRYTPSSHMESSFPSGPVAGFDLPFTISPKTQYLAPWPSTPSFKRSYVVFPSWPTSNRFCKNAECSMIHGSTECV